MVGVVDHIKTCLICFVSNSIRYWQIIVWSNANPDDLFSSEIGQHESCNLGFNPGHAVVTRKDNPNIDNIIMILTAMDQMYGVNQTDWKNFQLFNSTKYVGGNLLFKDSTTELKAISSGKRSYKDFLGSDYVNDTEALHKDCSISKAVSTKTAPYTMLVLALLSVLLL